MVSLSIIVPAYNEEKRITPTLESIVDFAASQSSPVEIIVVDDGSLDGTAEVSKSVGDGEVRVIRTVANRGKGHAVRTGMLAATGKYRLFTDADGSTPIAEFHGLRTALERSGGSGVAFGSIGLGGALVEQPQSGLRSTLGKFGNLMIRVLALPGVHDSQRGFKLLSADAAEAVFRRSVVNGWGFDVEALALARRLGFATTEVPVRWAHVEGGTLTPAAYLTTLGDVARVRWRLMVGSYDLSLNAAETVA